MKAAHDEAMFGVPTLQTPNDNIDNEVSENTDVKDDEGESNGGTINLLSEKVKFSELSFITVALEPIDSWSSISLFNPLLWVLGACKTARILA